MTYFDKALINVDLVHNLIASQFHKWASLPIKPVERSGWDNRMFRLGDSMVVRLPSGKEYSDKIEKEFTWLPKLAPLAPYPIPTPLAMRKPTAEYPYD